MAIHIGIHVYYDDVINTFTKLSCNMLEENKINLLFCLRWCIIRNRKCFSLHHRRQLFIALYPFHSVLLSAYYPKWLVSRSRSLLHCVSLSPCLPVALRFFFPQSMLDYIVCKSGFSMVYPILSYLI